MSRPVPSEEFKPALRFDFLTALFDPVVAVMSRERAFKQSVIERARVQSGEAVLDLGCGTGTLALLVHENRPDAAVTGLDADPAILERARAKALATGAPIAFDQALADELPYADASFDAVLSTLFFHHLDDQVKRTAATEALRVLRPGGRLIVADYGQPQDPLMRLAIATTVQMLDGRATTSLNVAGRLPSLLAEAGFEAIEVVDRLRTPTGTIEVIAARRPDADAS